MLCLSVLWFSGWGPGFILRDQASPNDGDPLKAHNRESALESERRVARNSQTAQILWGTLVHRRVIVLLVPTTLREVALHHDIPSSCHQGAVCTTEREVHMAWHGAWYWSLRPGMCFCNQNTNAARHCRCPLTEIERMHLDFHGPLPKSSRKLHVWTHDGGSVH